MRGRACYMLHGTGERTKRIQDPRTASIRFLRLCSETYNRQALQSCALAPGVPDGKVLF